MQKKGIICTFAHMYLEPETLFCAYATLVFIVCCLVCATVRWFHMCRPYDKQERYYYPARKHVAISYIVMGLLQIPYFLHPADPGAIIYTILAGILYFPMCFAIMFRVYFRLKLFYKPAYNIAFILDGLLLLALFLTALCGGNTFLAGHSGAVLSIGALAGLALTAILLSIVLRLRRLIDNYHHQNYSNESDFPLAFAKKVALLPFIWIVFIWAIFLSGNMILKAVSDLLLSALMVAFLCIILHPQRTLRETSSREAGDKGLSENDEVHRHGKAAEAGRELMSTGENQTESLEESLEEYLEECSEEMESVASGLEAGKEFDPETKEQVLEIILQRFREPHLQKRDVLAQISKGKVTLASQYISAVGYYNLINMFRLEYARQYSEAYPMVKQSIVAKEAGFASGPSFSKAKKSIRSIDPEFAAKIKTILH